MKKENIDEIELYSLYKEIKFNEYKKNYNNKFSSDLSKICTKVINNKFGHIPKKHILEEFKASEEYKESVRKNKEALEKLRETDFEKFQKSLEEDINGKYHKEFDILKDVLIDNKDKGNLSIKQLYSKAEKNLLKELEEFDIDSVLEGIREKFILSTKEQIEKILKEDDFTVDSYFDKKGNYHCEERLSSKNLDSFFSDLSDNFYQYINYNYDFFESYLIDYILNVCKTPEILDILNRGELIESDEVHSRLYDVVCDSKLSLDIWSEISNIFSDKFIIENLKQNELYTDVVSKYLEQKEIDEKLYKNVVDSIPKKYIDFYPLARKMKRKFYLHIGPTNSGKTYQSIQALEKADTGIYLSPLRLLAYEQFDRLNKDGIYCSLVTGEEEIIVPDATHQSSTIEMLDVTKRYDVAVIDEAQLIGDSERGGAWTKAILGVLAREVHICAAPEAEKILTTLINSCRDDLEVFYHTRDTELVMEDSQFSFPKDVREKDALIVFSKKDVHAVAAELQKRDIKCSVVYSALPYDVRHREAEKFNTGETDVVVSTDAIGMGLNMPIRRIIFLQNTKFDGKQVRTLYPSEVKQIAGRAGRRGMFEKGFVNTPFEKKKLRGLLNSSNKKIDKAYIGFPESLIGLDAKLSDIIKKWVEIETAPNFIKILGQREIFLSEMLEKKCDDKEFIYDFVTIPFDEEREELLDLWKKLFNYELKGTPLKLGNCGIMHFDKIESSEELHEVENEYSKLDLLYQYNRKFEHDEELPKIMKMKEVFSDLMMEFLKSQNLSGRKCKYCGKPLSWDYPYGMCDKCFKHRFGYKKRDWDDDEDYFEIPKF